MMAEHDFGDGAADGADDVLGRRLPRRFAIECDLRHAKQRLRVRAGKNVAPAFERLRPFRDVADRHVGNAEDAALLLHGPAVGEYATCMLL